MQNLTEEQIQERTELILTILDDFITETYDVDEDYVMTEEDAYITSIIVDYFEENFKFPTLKESALEAITGYDLNTPLYEEIYDVLLDESIGTFIAGAAHGIRNALSAYRKYSATKNKVKTVETENKAQKRLKDFKTNTPKPKDGILKNPTSEFQKQKGIAIQKRADKARAAKVSAETKRKSAVGKHSANVDKTKQLASRIDTGVQNIKNKTKQAISTGAMRIGGILGKVAGNLAR